MSLDWHRAVLQRSKPSPRRKQLIAAPSQPKRRHSLGPPPVKRTNKWGTTDEFSSLGVHETSACIQYSSKVIENLFEEYVDVYDKDPLDLREMHASRARTEQLQAALDVADELTLRTGDTQLEELS